MHLCEEKRGPQRMQREQDMLQQIETIPYVIIDYITNATTAEQEEDWSALEAHGSSSMCGKRVEKMCPGGDVGTTQANSRSQGTLCEGTLIF